MEMNFDPFVLPFFLGLLFLGAALTWKYIIWLEQIEVDDRRKMVKGVLSWRFFSAIKEVFLECLIHRKIFKINGFLGYMHMSLAFGWFLLIIAGSVESKYSQKEVFNMPWDPIFFNYFEPFKESMEHGAFFKFLMDFLLLVVLAAVALALVKRIWSRLFGMKRTTKLMLADKFTLASLWLIFPLRLLAESINAGVYNNGGFMTQPLGNAMASILPIAQMEYTSWWLYSLSLGVFFVALPFSRYMHIPTEIGLVFLRKFGLKAGDTIKGYANFEVQSCSRCGICIDKCQLAADANIINVQPAYFIQSVRYKLNFNDRMLNCLMCGRCNEYCPVGIDITHLRTIRRKEEFSPSVSDFNYLPAPKPRMADFPNVMYYAGCMTHLTPSIHRSMESIFKEAGINYEFIDRDGSICCGRPLWLAGKIEDARQLMQKNTDFIKSFGSMLLVTSCPICLRMFKEEYNLKIHLMHHTDFIEMLIEEKRINLRTTDMRIAYHDPCELGRGLKSYRIPRRILARMGQVLNFREEKEKAPCCGGSLANLPAAYEARRKIATKVVDQFASKRPDVISTACPLCKKNLADVCDVAPVKDIAEIVAMQLLAEHRKPSMDKRLISEKK